MGFFFCVGREGNDSWWQKGERDQGGKQKERKYSEQFALFFFQASVEPPVQPPLRG